MADHGKRKHPDCESDDETLSRPLKTNRLHLVSSENEDYSSSDMCSYVNQENSIDNKVGYYIEDYCEEGWFIGMKYISGDKPGYECRQDTREEAEEESTTSYAEEPDEYSDDESSTQAGEVAEEECSSSYLGEADKYSDEEKGGYYVEDYCEEGWFIGMKYIGEKAGYECKEDTGEEAEEEECSSYVEEADTYSNEESNRENGDFVEEYCEEGWFIGRKYIGDKGGYECKENTGEEDKEECSSSYVKEADEYSVH